MESYKTKANSYQARLEEAEIARAKAARAESFGMHRSWTPDVAWSHFVIARRSLADAEKAQAEAVAQRKTAEDQLQELQDKLRELEARLEEEGRDSSDLDVLRQRLAEEMEDERKQHLQDIEERDFTIDQTRKKYQGALLYTLVPAWR